MTKFVQVVTLMFAAQNLETNGKPIFQGINFKQDFDISLKPFQFKPFSFIKEHWSPFGVFGKKHGIQRRQVSGRSGIGIMNGALPPLEGEAPLPASTPIQSTRMTNQISSGGERIVPVQAPPVFEETEPMPISPLYAPPSIRPGIPMSNVGRPMAPNTSLAVPMSPVSSAPLPKVPLIVPPEMVKVEPVTPLVGNPHVSPVSVPPVKPAVRPPMPTRPNITPNIGGSVQLIPPTPVSTLLTDIYRDPAENLVQPLGSAPNKVVPIVTNSISEAPKPQQESTFTRASKLALNFSQMFMQLMNQFFTNARATINQFSNAPPVYRA